MQDSGFAESLQSQYVHNGGDACRNCRTPIGSAPRPVDASWGPAPRSLTACRLAKIPGLALFLIAATQVACSTEPISLTPEILLPRSIEGDGAVVYLSSVVEGIPDPIGRPTATLFQVPTGNVHLDDGPTSIVKGLRDALEATGYTVVTADEAKGSPTLTCRVSQMRFRSNDWAAPIIFISGQIELTMSLVASSGRTTWERTYLRKYHDDGTSVSFERGVDQAFNKALAAAMYDFGSPEFREACCNR